MELYPFSIQPIKGNNCGLIPDMDEKGPEQSNNNVVLKPNLNTALMVRRIIDDLINTFDFDISRKELSQIYLAVYVLCQWPF